MKTRVNATQIMLNINNKIILIYCFLFEKRKKQNKEKLQASSYFSVTRRKSKKRKSCI